MRRSPTATAISMASWLASIAVDEVGRHEQVPSQVREGSPTELRGWLVREQYVGLAGTKQARARLRNASLADKARGQAAARLAPRVPHRDRRHRWPPPTAVRRGRGPSRSSPPRPPAGAPWPARPPQGSRRPGRRPRGGRRARGASTRRRRRRPTPAQPARRTTMPAAPGAGRRQQARGGPPLPSARRSAAVRTRRAGSLERPGVGHVVAATLAGQQAVVDRLLQQGVTNA